MIPSNRDLLDYIFCAPQQSTIEQYFLKNRNLLHNYLVVPITTHTPHVRRKSIEKQKIIEKTDKKGTGYYIPIQDHPVSAEAGARCSYYLLWAIYMAVSMPGHGDLTALLMSRWLYRDALGTNCIDSSRGRAFGTNCGRMAIFCPTRKWYARKPTKMLASLGF